MVGWVVELCEEFYGLFGVFEFVNILDGDEVLVNVKVGVVDVFLVGFWLIWDCWEGDVIVWVEVVLLEVFLIGVLVYLGV